MMKALLGIVVPRTKLSGTELVGNEEEEIRQRAYKLYEERGRVDGYALKDWLQAEKEFIERDVAA
jgi:Protein of unknown function (DUF2934)